jgi:hypothetical protein
MLQKFLQLLLQTGTNDGGEPQDTASPVPPPPETPPADDRTRPSYRVGKHKPEDIHKALDMGG